MHESWILAYALPSVATIVCQACLAIVPGLQRSIQYDPNVSRERAVHHCLPGKGGGISQESFRPLFNGKSSMPVNVAVNSCTTAPTVAGRETPACSCAPVST